MKQDVYQKVTDKITADLEKGELTWLKPWRASNMDGRITKLLRHNGQTYSGMNVLTLWGTAVEAGYCSPYWMTFIQAKELGAHVRKGEGGNPVVYSNTIATTDEQENGATEERRIPFMKAYAVFNVEQIEGLPEHCYVKPGPVIDPAQRIAHAEASFGTTGADLRHGGNRAFYRVGSSDHVQTPLFVRIHSDVFWNEIDQALPDYTERKNWLKKHGDALNV